MKYVAGKIVGFEFAGQRQRRGRCDGGGGRTAGCWNGYDFKSWSAGHRACGDGCLVLLMLALMVMVLVVLVVLVVLLVLLLRRLHLLMHMLARCQQLGHIVGHFKRIDDSRRCLHL